jgi:Outer membrane protein beta-barrel domain
MQTRRLLPCLSPPARGPLGPTLAFAVALGLGLTTRGARAEAPKKDTYALGWTRLAGAEPCIASRDLATGVERSLKRRVFVSAARADRYVEGRVGPRLGGGWTAAVQIADAKGRILGTRELMSDGPNCRDLDDAITLSVALMIDSNLSVPPADPLESAPSAAAVDAVTPDAASPSQPDKSDPWGAPAAPPPAPARASSGPRGPGEEGFELGALTGFSFGNDSVSRDGASSSSLGFGLGVRAGYQFAMGFWVGVGFVRHAGGDFESPLEPQDIIDYRRVDPEYSAGVTGSVAGTYHVYMPSLEAGYAFALGPFEARPYLGFGFAVYEFKLTSVSAADKGTPLNLTLDDVSFPHNALNFAAWPGFSMVWPVDNFFVGADARMVYIIGASPSFVPSLTAGIRL